VTEPDFTRDSVTSPNNDAIEPKMLTFSTKKPTKKSSPSKRKATIPKKMCTKCGKLGHDATNCKGKKRKQKIRRQGVPKKSKKTIEAEALQMMQSLVNFSKCIYFVIDLETTGFHRVRNRIIEIASVSLDKDGTVITGSQFDSLVNPKQDIQPIITELTHISEDMIKNKPSFDIVGVDFV
jgi:uncharacterized protein YprB with RNaseH-like and TPR domain